LDRVRAPPPAPCFEVIYLYFPELDDGWATVGPHVGGPPSLQGPVVQILQVAGERVQLVGEQVPVGVQGDAGGRMPELLLHGLDAGALADEQ
jgi:hypothetical protein